MPQPAILQQLLDLIEPTLPMFLADAGLTTFPGPESIRAALESLVADQRDLVERAGTLLDEQGGAAPRRGYPIRYTALHDVDLASLLPGLVTAIDQQAAALDTLLGSTAPGPEADLVRDALQSARFHGDALRALAAPRPAATLP